jgi:hypothetical protein
MSHNATQRAEVHVTSVRNRLSVTLPFDPAESLRSYLHAQGIKCSAVKHVEEGQAYFELRDDLDPEAVQEIIDAWEG